MSPRKKGKSAKHSKRKSLQAGHQDVEIEEHYDFESNPSSYFLHIISCDDHLRAQKDHRTRYIATVVKLVQMKIEILPSSKVKALVCAWIRNDLEMAEGFLSMKKVFNFVEVAKAVSILDIPREIRALEKKKLKLKALEESKKCVVKEATLRKLDRKISVLSGQKLSCGSMSGAMARHVRRWINTFNQTELEFMAMNFDTGMWRELADKVHFHPEKDFASVPWFLPYCYGKSAPEGTDLYRVGTVTADNVNEVLQTTPLPFHKVSKFKDVLTDDSKAIVALHDDSVSRAIWWYEDLGCSVVDEVILQRLCAEEHTSLDLSYGKLMERLMLLRPKGVCFYPRLMEIAERKLTECQHSLQGPIGVFADASGSMEVAIKMATIVSSFLTVFTQAKLVFFNNNHWSPEKNPDSISDVIETALGTIAEGSTSPAAALWPFYSTKEHLKTIILVTDEEENTAYNGYMFCPLFQKYVDEVGPCDLIFISFLKSQHNKGQMVEQLRACNIALVQHVLSSIRPDISRLDSIIGKMTLNTSSFLEVISSIESTIEDDGVRNIFKNIGL